MDLLGRKKNREEKKKLEGTIRQLWGRIHEFQATVDTLATSYDYETSTTKYNNGNRYRNRKEQVGALLKKFRNEADYGCEIVQMAANLLAAFTLPSGVELALADDFDKTNDDTGEREMEFIKGVLDNNNMTEGNAFRLAREYQLQGAVVITMEWGKRQDNDKNESVLLCYLPWYDSQYAIKAVGKSNLTGPYELTYKDDQGKPQELKDEKFAFVMANDELGKFNGRPRMVSQLTSLEDLSRDFERWGVINDLFCHPTPYFECEDSAEATTIRDLILEKGWRVGQSFAATAKFSFVSPNADTIDMLEKAIKTRIKMLSGAIQIAVHLLGWADVLSNRSTAESMGEPTEIISKSEIGLWRGFYEDLFDKSIRLYNANKPNEGEDLREGVVVPKLLPMSDRQWSLISEVWLPIFKERGVDLQTFLEQLPNIDVEKVLERVKEAEAERLKNMPPESGFMGGKTGTEDDEGEEDLTFGQAG